MKFLKVKMARSDDGGHTHYDYPSEYDASKVKIGPQYETFNADNVSGVKGRSPCYEYCMIGVEDADALSFLESVDITEVTEAVFRSNGEGWSPTKKEKIVDSNEVITICKKVAKSESLTDAEKAKINPNKPDTGINMTKEWGDYVSGCLGHITKYDFVDIIENAGISIE